MDTTETGQTLPERALLKALSKTGERRRGVGGQSDTSIFRARPLTSSRKRQGLFFSVRNLVQPTCLHVVDKTPHGHALGNPGGATLLSESAPNVFVDIADCMKMVWSKGCGSGFILEPSQQIIIFDCQHHAVRVVDDYKLPSAARIMRNDELAQRNFCHDAACVANRMNVSHTQNLRQG